MNSNEALDKSYLSIKEDLMLNKSFIMQKNNNNDVSYSDIESVSKVKYEGVMDK